MSEETGFAPRCLCLDLEIDPGDKRILKIGALRPDTDAFIYFKGNFDLAAALGELDRLAAGASFVLGHNIIRHDLNLLKALAPGLKLLELPVVDTLTLSPLAFPRNPYHHLVKDYRLLKLAVNDPLADAQRTVELFRDQRDALQREAPEVVRAYHYLLAPEGANSGLNNFFMTLTKAARPGRDEAVAVLRQTLDNRVCRPRLERLLTIDLDDSTLRPAIAYVLAWLRVAGENSVMPPWVRFEYPSIVPLVRELRATPCKDARFLRLLDGRLGELMLLPQLLALVADLRGGEADSPGNRLVTEFLEDFGSAVGEGAHPIAVVLDAAYEFLAEADRRSGDGVCLTTAHGAKGLEFDHVVVLDGGWRTNGQEALAERRLYYVAMTRARQTLALCRMADAMNSEKNFFDKIHVMAADSGAFGLAREKLRYDRELLALDVEHKKTAAAVALDHALSLEEEAAYLQAKEDLEVAYKARTSEGTKTFGVSLVQFEHQTTEERIQTLATGLTNMTAVGAQKNHALFEINKRAAEVNAIVSGRQAVQDSYAFGAKWGGPWGGAAMAAIAVAATMANVDAIESTQFGGGGGGISSVGGGGGIPSLAPSPGVPVSVQSSNLSTPTPALGQPAPAPQQINLTIVGNDKSVFTYDQVVNQLIPMLGQAAGNGVNIKVTMA